MAASKKSVWKFTQYFKSNLKSVLIYGLLVNFIIAVILIFACPDCLNNWTLAYRHFIVSMIYGMGLFFGLSSLNSYLGKRVPWLKKPWTAFIIVIISNIVCVVLIVTISNVIWRYWFLDMLPPTAIKQVTLQEFVIPLFIALLITSIFQGAAFLNTWKTSLLETEHFKQAQLSAKYEMLNSQVNPHFLFNSLNVLSSLVKKDPDKAETFIHHLSDVYRNILDIRKEELITLETELNTLEAYQFLLKTRYEDRINIKCDLQASDTTFIVPLSLQMLIENAVKHNASTRKVPLQVHIYEQDNIAWVVNNKSPLNEEVPGKKMGLDNIRERYQLATGQAIIVEDSETTFKVGLPLIID